MAVTTFTTPNESLPCIDYSTPNDATVDKTRHLIDREMQRLEDSIRLLKSRRNVLAPISRLPPEMLAKIFAFRVADSIESTNPLEWIRVSHVSRYWRAVALDCPRLWGNLVFSRPRWSEEMLKRSKMAGLVVKADLSCITPRIFEAVRLALLHGPRIHHLQLRAGSATIERLLTTKSLELPMIHSLSLAVPRVTRFGTDEGFTIPDAISSGEAPYLRRLELQKVNIAWDSNLLKGLTHLTIHDIATSLRPSTDQLMDALERMPALQVLDLQDALPQSPTEPPSSARFLALNELTHLVITSTVPECSNFLARLSIPASARVQMSCSGTEATGGDFSGIMKIISNPRGAAYRQESKVGLPERKITRVLHIHHEAPISLIVRGWTNALSPQEAFTHVNEPDIQLHLSWHYSAQTKVDYITTAICRSIPIAHLRSLRLTHVNGITPKTWIGNFGFLPKLHSVHVAGDSAHTLIAALREEVPIELTSPVTPGGMLGVRRPGLRRRRSAIPSVYFPHLTTLTMEDVSFEEHAGIPSNPVFENLQNCLMERSERKSEIQELYLRECNHLYEEHVDDLRGLVTTLDWDGIEQDFADDDDESVIGYDEMGGYMFGGYNVYGEEPDLDLDFGFNPSF
ncbi:hypothetical protein H0H87_003897 [Tephrocybe sp. NHM501043]|nr:hypothetical protein H0H87_003897 [Tephrocybe sp. NHM501043]